MDITQTHRLVEVGVEMKVQSGPSMLKHWHISSASGTGG